MGAAKANPANVTLPPCPYVTRSPGVVALEYKSKAELK